MTHDWEHLDFHVPGVTRERCRLCGVEAVSRGRARYVHTRPRGEQQLECPASCEEAAVLAVLES